MKKKCFLIPAFHVNLSLMLKRHILTSIINFNVSVNFKKFNNGLETCKNWKSVVYCFSKPHELIHSKKVNCYYNTRKKNPDLLQAEKYSGTESICFYCLPSHRSVINRTMSANKTKQSYDIMYASCLIVVSAMETIFHLTGKE